MNGAGAGGQFVTYKNKRTGRYEPGKIMLGNRRQRYNDIRVSLGLSPT